MLLTFDPHPRFVLFPDDDKLKLISTIDEKEELLSPFGLDHLVIAKFSKEFNVCNGRLCRKYSRQ